MSSKAWANLMIPLHKVKRMLARQPDKLIAFLKSYGFCGFRERSQYISFGRDVQSSYKSIVIYKQNNDSLLVHDYAKCFNGDIVDYLQQEKGVDPEECAVEMQRALRLSSFSIDDDQDIEESDYKESRDDTGPELIDESVLDQFPAFVNERFLRDGISFQTQKKFGLRYDTVRMSIIIPIRNAEGNLIGVKARVNRDVQHGELKYTYVENCQITKTLYGYYENRNVLKQSKDICIFEAEKSVMQADGFDIHNCVALGSSVISPYQCELLKALEPERLVLMFDKGLMDIYVKRNIERIRQCFGENIKIVLWNPSESVPDKSSPTDLGERGFQRAIREELVEWNPI